MLTNIFITINNIFNHIFSVFSLLGYYINWLLIFVSIIWLIYWIQKIFSWKNK